MDNQRERRRRTERMQYEQGKTAQQPYNSLPNAGENVNRYPESYMGYSAPVQGGTYPAYQAQAGAQTHYQPPQNGQQQYGQGGQRYVQGVQPPYVTGSQQAYVPGAYPQEPWRPEQSVPYQQRPAGEQKVRVYPPVAAQGYGGPDYRMDGMERQKMGNYSPNRRPIWKSPFVWVPVLILVFVAAAVGIAQSISAHRAAQERAALQEAVRAYETRFCEGVYVDDIDLGGMSQREAMDAVQKKAQDKRDAWSVTLQYGDESWLLNAEQLGMRVNIADALDAAWAQGHSGTVTERKQQMDALETEPFHSYTSLSEGDISVIDRLLEDIAASINRPVEDASIESFNASLTYPFTFHNEQAGVEVDVESLRAQLQELVSTMTNGTLNIEPEIKRPSVTVEDIKRTQLSVRGEGMTEISTTSTENRNDNIRRSFELINGVILKPGEVFSFNGVVGKRTRDNGFKEAIEYQNGKEVNAIGGGVCQSSTTLYQAAIKAGLEIVKREPHSLQVGYSSYGMDATVYWEYGRQIDFQFRNNTESNLYIKAVVEWSKAANRWVTHVTYYGEPLPSGVSYDFDVLQEVIPAPAEPKLVQDKKGEYAVYKDEMVETQKAKDGVRVTSYRVMYQNGQEVLREYLDTDEYPPKQQVIYVGVKNY